MPSWPSLILPRLMLSTEYGRSNDGLALREPATAGVQDQWRFIESGRCCTGQAVREAASQIEVQQLS